MTLFKYNPFNFLIQTFDRVSNLWNNVLNESSSSVIYFAKKNLIFENFLSFWRIRVTPHSSLLTLILFSPSGWINIPFQNISPSDFSSNLKKFLYIFIRFKQSCNDWAPVIFSIADICVFPSSTSDFSTF